MNWKSPLRENLESLIFPLILVLITRTFIFQAFKIPSESMRDTLLVGDHILVNKSIYFDPIPGLGFSLFPTRDPQRKDIMVFKFPDDPSKDYIKRLIGLPGETLTIDCPHVYVNGQPVEDSAFAIYRSTSSFDRCPEPCCNESRRQPKKEPTVPDGHYFMMGDNRNNSEDSRFWGFLDRDLIKGKAFVIYFSWDSREFDERMRDAAWWEPPINFIATIRWDRTFRLLH